MTRVPVAAWCLALASSLASAQDPQRVEPRKPTARAVAPADVSDRVLQVIRELQSEGSDVWYPSAVFEKRSLQGMPARLIGYVPRDCVVVQRTEVPFFDLARARRHAITLFACYGVTLSSDVELKSGARLDGFDPESGLGFLLREVQPDVSWVSELAARGVHVQVSVPQRSDGDELIPVLAYLAALVEFLNEHTDGPDVDLTPALWSERQRFHVGASVPRDRDCLVRFAAPTAGIRTVVIPVDPDRCEVETIFAYQGRRALHKWLPIARPYSTSGKISILAPRTMQVQRSGKILPWGLVQELADGGELRIESQGFVIFTPPSFDAARPFHLEIDLEPGSECAMSEDLWVGGPHP
jgi:hypothetical protein